MIWRAYKWACPYIMCFCIGVTLTLSQFWFHLGVLKQQITEIETSVTETRKMVDLYCPPPVDTTLKAQNVGP